MTGAIDNRLSALGIQLPEVTAPVANYVPFVQIGPLVYISGQLPVKDGSLLHIGIVGDTVSAEEAAVAAQQCALNIIAQLKFACDGDLDRVTRIIKISGFVASIPAFTGHPAVINGASDVIVKIFGEVGRHARAAVGCPSLPLGAPVEIEAIAEISSRNE